MMISTLIGYLIATVVNVTVIRFLIITFGKKNKEEL